MRWDFWNKLMMISITHRLRVMQIGICSYLELLSEQQCSLPPTVFLISLIFKIERVDEPSNHLNHEALIFHRLCASLICVTKINRKVLLQKCKIFVMPVWCVSKSTAIESGSDVFSWSSEAPAETVVKKKKKKRPSWNSSTSSLKNEHKVWSFSCWI